MQKNIFLDGEGDAWFERNRVSLNYVNDADDPVIISIENSLPITEMQKKLKLIEIGCGNGIRLTKIKNKYSFECYGIDPSANAVSVGQGAGLNVLRGTADDLPYDSCAFDVVVFGHCLYLCDREDLFRIGQEADRVLKADGWVVIHDFFSNNPVRNSYHHKQGVYSYKMDYRKIFDWHPAYTCVYHKIRSQSGLIMGNSVYCDDPNEWVSTSVLRKKQGHV